MSRKNKTNNQKPTITIETQLAGSSPLHIGLTLVKGKRVDMEYTQFILDAGLSPRNGYLENYH